LKRRGAVKKSSSVLFQEHEGVGSPEIQRLPTPFLARALRGEGIVTTKDTKVSKESSHDSLKGVRDAKGSSE
jgi:hypothetical protein